MVEHFEKSDGRRYWFSGSKRRISVIYEQISIGFAVWWSAQRPLTNRDVEIGMSDNARNSVISRKMDIGFCVHEPEND